MGNRPQQPQKEDDSNNPTRAMQWFGLIFVPLLSIGSILIVFFLARDWSIPVSLIMALINSPTLCFTAKRMAQFLFPLSDNERMLEILKSVDDQKAKKIQERMASAQKLLGKRQKPF